MEVKDQNFKDLVEYVKQNEPGSKFVDPDNVNAGTGPGPFQMNDRCIIDDHSINVIDIFKALGFNYCEMHMPLKYDVDDFEAVAQNKHLSSSANTCKASSKHLFTVNG